MKKLFPGYILPSQEEFKDLWENCIFSLDANVLLSLYEYTPETRADFLKVLSRISPQLWLTHQATWEFLRHRLEVIRRQITRIEKIRNALEATKTQTIEEITKLKWHPFFHGEKRRKISSNISRSINNLVKQFDNILAERKEDYPDWNKWKDNDPILSQLVIMFKGKIGSGYDEDAYGKKLQEAEERCKAKTPPGYKDYKPNSADNTFGDVIIWFQLLDKAKEDQKPIIFITGDSKDDWWSKIEGETIGPRPKLAQEFLIKTGQRYYQYKQLRFIEFAKEFFDLEFSEESMTEVEEVSKKADEVIEQEVERNLLAHSVLQGAPLSGTQGQADMYDKSIFGPTWLGSNLELDGLGLSPSQKDFYSSEILNGSVLGLDNKTSKYPYYHFPDGISSAQLAELLWARYELESLMAKNIQRDKLLGKSIKNKVRKHVNQRKNKNDISKKRRRR